METGRFWPDFTGITSDQAGTHGIRKYSCKYRVPKGKRGQDLQKKKNQPINLQSAF